MRLPSQSAGGRWASSGMVMVGASSRAARPESLCPDVVGPVAEPHEQVRGDLDEAGGPADVAGRLVAPEPTGREEVLLVQAPGGPRPPFGCAPRVDQLDVDSIRPGEGRKLVAIEDVLGATHRVDEPERRRRA